MYKAAGSSRSMSYLYLIMGGMIGSSALTIVVVKTIKCLQKRDDQKSNQVAHHTVPGKSDQMSETALSHQRDLSFTLSKGYGTLTHQDLLKEIIEQRNSILLARAGQMPMPRPDLESIGGTDADEIIDTAGDAASPNRHREPAAYKKRNSAKNRIAKFENENDGKVLIIDGEDEQQDVRRLKKPKALRDT